MICLVNTIEDAEEGPIDEYSFNGLLDPLRMELRLTNTNIQLFNPTMDRERGETRSKYIAYDLPCMKRLPHNPGLYSGKALAESDTMSHADPSG